MLQKNLTDFRTAPDCICEDELGGAYLDQQIVNKVSRSYGQCCTSAGFFDDFYTNFLGMSQDIASKFRHTDLARQKTLLRAGLGHLVMAYAKSPMSRMKMNKIAESHSRNALDVDPKLYPLWKKALLKTIATHDREYNSSIEKAWSKIVDAGVKGIIDRY